MSVLPPPADDALTTSTDHGERQESVLRDPALLALPIVLVGLVLPYLLRGLDPAAVYWFGEYFGQPVLLVVVLWAVLRGVRSIHSSAERRFWRLIALGIGFNLLVRGLYLVPGLSQGDGSVVVDVCYALFYFSLIRALQLRPDREDEPREGPLAIVETAATAVFLAGLVFYFVLIPRIVTPEGYGTWVPSLIMYWVLDAYLVATLIYMHQSSVSHRWRVTYAWLGLAALLWAATDMYEALWYLHRVSWIDDGSIWNTVWYVPYALVGIAARLRGTGRPSAFAAVGLHPDPNAPRAGAMGVVVLYALVLPVLHFVSNLTGLMDPASRDARELTVVVYLPLLLGIAFIHQRLAERRAQRLESAGRDLEAQRTVLTTAMEQATNAIMVVDAEDRVVYANPAWVSVIGAGPDELLGGRVSTVLEPMGPVALDALSVAKTEGTASAHITRPHPGGGASEEIFTVSSVRGRDGDITHFAISLQDITHETMLERQLRQAERMEALGTLAGGIAHDFNNVLAAILGFSELVLDDLDADEPARQDVGEILKAAERAKSLTTQILTFSRQKDAERKPLRLGAAVLEALGLIRATVPSSIDFRVYVDPERGLIMAEEGRIHQVVMNLVTNALQAMGEKGTLEVSVTEGPQIWSGGHAPTSVELPPGRYAVLSVADTGSGIDAEIMERLYDPFFTTKELGHGTGLGLSVVHGIVGGHGGAIAVESEPGRGSCFKVYLPLIDTSAQGIRSSEETVDLSELGAVRILLVDDEDMVVTVLARSLERAGLRVTKCNDPREVLAAFRATPTSFDLLVTDQIMPGLTGLELAAEVHEISPEIPVLLVTGFSETVGPGRLAASGVTEVLYKPVRRVDLLAAVDRIIRSVGVGSGSR
jgi:PAS domain S-box-containing protein